MRHNELDSCNKVCINIDLNDERFEILIINTFEILIIMYSDLFIVI